MNDLLISVVVPVYKVEDYLKTCIESVLNQSYQNIEVILVDDGSPDNSPQICDEYASIDKRVNVIHKLNGGLSNARNTGLRIAKGDYIIFLDSDDYWSDRNALLTLVDIIKCNIKVDIIYFRRFAFSHESGLELYRYPEFKIEKVNGRSKDDSLLYLISNDRFIPSACNKIVRRKVLEGIEFQEHILSEDIDWNFKLTMHAEYLFVTNHLFYAYRVRKGSITQTITDRNINDLLNIVEKWSVSIHKNAISEKEIVCLLSYCAYQLSIILGLIYSIPEKNKVAEFIKRVQRLAFLWKYNRSKKVRRVKLLYTVFGIKFTGMVLGFYLKNRR